MRVLVLGSGVIGVTSAYYLARAGHEVTVVDREAGPALDTSFANAGQISPGYASPWAAPGVPLKAIKWMFQQHAPLSIRPDGTLFQLQWMWQMLRNCNAASYAENKERMVRLAEYSRDCIRALRAESGIAYEGRQQGTLQVFRTQQQLDGAANDIAVLERAGVPYELLSRDDLVRSEPGLASTRHKLAGGLRLPNDETGDCQLFTTRLAAMAEKLGVRFRFNSRINSLIVQNDAVRGALVDGEAMTADLVVVAMGSYNPFPGVIETAPSSRGYTGGFGTDLMLKDLGLAGDAAKSVRQPVYLGALAQQLYQASSSQGAAKLDFSAVIRLYRPEGAAR